MTMTVIETPRFPQAPARDYIRSNKVQVLIRRAGNIGFEVHVPKGHVKQLRKLLNAQ